MSALFLLDPVELRPYFDFRNGGALAHGDYVLYALGDIFRNQVASLLFRRCEISISVELRAESEVRADGYDAELVKLQLGESAVSA